MAHPIPKDSQMKTTRLLFALAVSAVVCACSAAEPTAPSYPQEPLRASILIGSGNAAGDTTRTTNP